MNTCSLVVLENPLSTVSPTIITIIITRIKMFLRDHLVLLAPSRLVPNHISLKFPNLVASTAFSHLNCQHCSRNSSSTWALWKFLFAKFQVSGVQPTVQQSHNPYGDHQSVRVVKNVREYVTVFGATHVVPPPTPLAGVPRLPYSPRSPISQETFQPAIHDDCHSVKSSRKSSVVAPIGNGVQIGNVSVEYRSANNFSDLQGSRKSTCSSVTSSRKSTVSTVHAHEPVIVGGNVVVPRSRQSTLTKDNVEHYHEVSEFKTFQEQCSFSVRRHGCWTDSCFRYASAFRELWSSSSSGIRLCSICLHSLILIGFFLFTYSFICVLVTLVCPFHVPVLKFLLIFYFFFIYSFVSNNCGIVGAFSFFRLFHKFFSLILIN